MPHQEEVLSNLGLNYKYFNEPFKPVSPVKPILKIKRGSTRKTNNLISQDSSPRKKSKLTLYDLIVKRDSMIPVEVTKQMEQRGRKFGVPRIDINLKDS